VATQTLKHLTSVKSEYEGWAKFRGHDGKVYYVGKDPNYLGWVATDSKDVILHEGNTRLEVLGKLDAAVGKGVSAKSVAKDRAVRVSSLPLTERSTVPAADDLVGVAEIAELAGVGRSAVSNWIKRHPRGFPSPAAESRAGPVFRHSEIAAWLQHSKKITVAPKPLEVVLWAAADKMRGNLEAAEYKHVVLGLVFLKYVSDAFEERHYALEQEVADPTSDGYVKNPDRRLAVIESRDEYTSQNVFWVPVDARWSWLQERAKQPDVGVLIDNAMDAIEKENPVLKGVLPKTYARNEIDKRLLGELVDLIGSIGFTKVDHGSDDLLGRVYEYFLGRFASAEGRNAGEFYTPRSVVRLLVEMLEPYKGRVFDPCCGSGGMFVQSAEFVAAHGGKRNDLSIYGQEFVASTWRLAKMNLAIRGIEANLGDRADDSFHRDLHPDLRADFIMANPPFNMDDWYSEALREDRRWKYGRPPASNGNFAWVQHFVHHLSPSGNAGFVLANGSLSSQSSGEGEIRKNLVESELVDCIVALPDRLFFNTGIPVCLWFLAKNRQNGKLRDRRGEILFIDARTLGRMETRTIRVLDDADITRIAEAYHTWRDASLPYEDVPGFCRSAPIEEVARHEFVLSPGRYVGSDGNYDEGATGPEEIKRLLNELHINIEEGRRLDKELITSLKGFGYE
jgi:type I restriction enzyme M protein